jgi:putative ABC transport system permease protein
VAIVNQTLARQFWPGQSAVGRSFHSGGFDTDPFEIVGVARDHKVRSVGEADRAYLHRPASPSRGVGLVVRTTLPADTALPALRQALLSLEPDIVFTEDVSAAQVADTTMAPTRMAAVALGAFGGLALLLASVGLYSVVAYSVSRRTREVGIRMALGAARGQVLRLILLQGARLALVGVLFGVVASLGVGRLLESLLYGVSSIDPLAYVAAAGLMALVALAANLMPALGAARVDPVRALRTE